MTSESKTFFTNPYHEDRPWGSFDQFTQNYPSTVKIITVNPGESTSLQRHALRQEFWYIISGNGELTIGEEKKEATAGLYINAEIGTEHRLQGGTEKLVLLEVSIGTFDEQDIERLEDKYNRV
jgi:mannose-6-phosphate isomerase